MKILKIPIDVIIHEGQKRREELERERRIELEIDKPFWPKEKNESEERKSEVIIIQM